MIKCVYCLASVAPTAKRCPFCGGRPRGEVRWRLIGMVAVAAALVILLAIAG